MFRQSIGNISRKTLLEFCWINIGLDKIDRVKQGMVHENRQPAGRSLSIAQAKRKIRFPWKNESEWRRGDSLNRFSRIPD